MSDHVDSTREYYENHRPKPFKLDSKDECKAVNFVQKACGKDQARPVLTGILVQNGNIVASDGFRMHVGITPEAFKEYQGEIIQVVNNDKPAAVKTTPTIQELQKVEGRFPDWSQIMPDKKEDYSPVLQIAVNKKYLADLLNMPGKSDVMLRFSFTDPMHPILIEGAEGYKAVIMPMKWED